MVVQRSPAASAPHVGQDGHVYPGTCRHRRAAAAVELVDIPFAWRFRFTEQGDLLLGGGACVDDRVLRRMPATARAAIRAAGGLYQHALAWSVRNLGPQTKAIFGFCGDALAERADIAVGFKHTMHPKLLVYFTRDLEQHERDRLIAEAHAVGPF